jgi:hypothetical protein
MLSIIFGLPCTWEKRAFSKEKPASSTDFGIVFYVVYIIFGLPCTCEKRAFSKEKPPGAGSRKQQNVGQGTGSTTSGAVILHS